MGGLLKAGQLSRRKRRHVRLSLDDLPLDLLQHLRDVGSRKRILRRFAHSLQHPFGFVAYSTSMGAGSYSSMGAPAFARPYS